MANSLSGLVGLTVGLPCRQVRNALRIVRACAHTQLLSGRFFGDGAPEPSLDPACCGRSVPEAGPISLSAYFSPQEPRPLATRPSPGRVRSVWNSAVLRSGELGASRHETGSSRGERDNRTDQCAKGLLTISVEVLDQEVAESQREAAAQPRELLLGKADRRVRSGASET